MGRDRRAQGGVTLTELMISIVVLSVGVLGLTAAFSGIQKSLQRSRYRTLSANLAQEKMQVLKQLDYYQVLVTTTALFQASYAPNIPYDPGYFPPETVLAGGVTFQRLTYVESVSENDTTGVVSALPPGSPDIGMKRITVSVLWTSGGKAQVYQLSSILTNYTTVMANAVLRGAVTDAGTAAAIPGAWAYVAENPGWKDTTDNAGAYALHVAAGSFDLVVSATGYLAQRRAISIGATSQTQNFQLTRMASGTIQGTAWMNPGLVISQVVGSTATQVNNNAALTCEVEYVELFNPTTAQISLTNALGRSDSVIENVRVNADRGGTHNRDIMNAGCVGGGAHCVYVSSYVAPSRYFLIASFPSFLLNGVWVTADAYYNDAAGSCPDLIPNHAFGGVQVASADGAVLDQVCWSGANGGPSSYCNGTPIPTDSSCGLNTGYGSPGCHGPPYKGNQLTRKAAPGSVWRTRLAATFGSAYNSGDNSLDWSYPASGSPASQGLNYNPLTSAATATVIAGVPADKAWISASDGLSAPGQAALTGSPPSATFSLAAVATGTWSVFISSRGYMLENDTVTLVATGSVYTFPSSTTLLSQGNGAGFITGTVTDIFGNAISPAVRVSLTPGAAGPSVNADTGNGRYLLRVVPGAVDVTVNANNGSNPGYVSQSSQAIIVALGEDHSGVNFMLSQGGRIAGFLTRDGTNALPGVAVTVLDANGQARDTQVSDFNGRFTTLTVATGAYTVTPDVGAHEFALPVSPAVTVANGVTVWAATFTVTGAMGTVKGSVSYGGKPIGSGAFIVITTATLSGSPPAPPSFSAATIGVSGFFVGSSNEDGTYSIDVVQSTAPAYNVYAYYSTVSPSGAVSVQWKPPVSVTVTAGAVVAGVDFAW